MKTRLGLLLLLLTLIMGPCVSRQGTIKLISAQNPPTFEIGGTGDLGWIWFQGPYQNPSEPAPPLPENSDPKSVILWKIYPSGDGEVRPFIPFGDVPPITYGRLPQNWEQEIPKSGSPPALRDGYVYTVQGVGERAGHAAMCVFIKNGQALPYEDKDPNSCRKRD